MIEVAHQQEVDALEAELAALRVDYHQGAISDVVREVKARVQAQQERDRARNIAVLLEAALAASEEMDARLMDALEGYSVTIGAVLDYADDMEARAEDSEHATASQVAAVAADAQRLRDTVAGTT